MLNPNHLVNVSSKLDHPNQISPVLKEESESDDIVEDKFTYLYLMSVEKMGTSELPPSCGSVLFGLQNDFFLATKG